MFPLRLQPASNPEDAYQISKLGLGSMWESWGDL